MDAVTRRVSYDALKTIVDVPECFSGHDVEIVITRADNAESERIFNELRGSIKHDIGMETARAERLRKE